MTEATPIRLPVDQLELRVTRVLQGFGCDGDIAAEVARHLIRAEASGHASHGILRLSQYRDEIARGTIVPQARPEVVHDDGGTVLIDAHHGFGHFTIAVAVDLLAERARAQGVAAVAVRGTTHIGRLGEYTERLNGRGLVSIITVGAAGPGIGAMAPFGTKAGPFLNSNPFAIGVPGQGRSFVFDAAMSNIAEGKVHAARDRHVDLPPGAILDARGEPSTKPADYYAGGTLTPLGGTLAGHKGYGLALAAALLGGLSHADGSRPDVTGIASTAGAGEQSSRIGGVTMIALDPGRIGGDADSYARLAGEVLEAFHEVGAVIPGEFEATRRGTGEMLALEPRAEATLAQLEADLDR